MTEGHRKVVVEVATDTEEAASEERYLLKKNVATTCDVSEPLKTTAGKC